MYTNKYVLKLILKWLTIVNNYNCEYKIVFDHKKNPLKVRKKSNYKKVTILCLRIR